MRHWILAFGLLAAPVAASAQTPLGKPNTAPAGLAAEKPAEVNLLGEKRDPAQLKAELSAPKGGQDVSRGKPEPGVQDRTRMDPLVGHPLPDGTGLQPAVTPIAEKGRWMNDVLLEPLMAAVVVVVFGLLGYAMISFRRKDGKEPQRFSHNTLVEVAWTTIPVIILVVIAVPSFQLLASQYDPPKPDLTVKAIGHQWYWEYQYPDNGGWGFDSVMLTDEKAAAEGSPRLLEVDNRLVVPAGATVKVLVTGADVGHSWAVPAFWVKMDGWPGRINETWFKTDRPGVYYGQCSELCGVNHGYMPVVVEVLPKPQFAAWLAAKQKENGVAPGAGSAEAQSAAAAGSSSASAPAPASPSAAVAAEAGAAAATPVATAQAK
ncbi:MAG: cytochrome c oxidase subunit II [Sphingomonadaceae bacterium]|nr:cytochrome c oxidase subunit II [Sphingomonadaceae bacterium]